MNSGLDSVKPIHAFSPPPFPLEPVGGTEGRRVAPRKFAKCAWTHPIAIKVQCAWFTKLEPPVCFHFADFTEIIPLCFMYMCVF